MHGWIFVLKLVFLKSDVVLQFNLLFDKKFWNTIMYCYLVFVKFVFCFQLFVIALRSAFGIMDYVSKMWQMNLLEGIWQLWFVTSG